MIEAANESVSHVHVQSDIDGLAGVAIHIQQTAMDSLIMAREDFGSHPSRLMLRPYYFISTNVH